LDLNDKRGQNEMLLEWERQLAQQPLSAGQIMDKMEQAMRLLSGIEFFAFRLRTGDDASCLNLYKPRDQRMRLLGTPQRLIQRGGFRFAGARAQTREQKENPWLLLDEPLQEEDGKKVIPVIGEQNS